MERVIVWGLSGRKSPIVARLYEMGVFHLDAPDEEILARHPLLKKLREQRGKVLGLIEVLAWDGWKKLTGAFVENVRYNLSGDLEPMMAEIGRSLDRIEARISRIKENCDGAEDSLAALRRGNVILSRAYAFLEQESAARGVVGIWKLSRQAQHVLISRINGDLDLLPSGHEKPWFRYHSFALRDGSFLVTSASQEVQPHLEDAVADMKGTRWEPPCPFGESSLLEASSRIKRHLRSLPAQIRENKQDLRKLSAQWGANLGAVYILLNERLEQLLMEVSAKENEDFFWLEGWVPENELGRTSAILKEDFGDAVILRSRPPSPEDGAVPTALRNTPFFKPFELFLRLLRVPRYDAYDPSPLIGIFFPFFAGCMIGDIGYGVLILWLGWHMRQKRSETFRDVGFILLFIAFWSVAWGIVFGEFFGDAGHRLLHMEPLWLDRSRTVPPVMMFSVALGAAHVCLGLFIGMIQGFRNRRRHLWMERAGNLLVILSLIAALTLLRLGLPKSLFSVPVSLLTFGLIFLIRGGGVGGVVESLGTIGNIVSYVRIAAIGLSSAILAMVASAFADRLGALGVPALGLFVAFAIHLLNFVLAMGGSALHSARLHYVEFMGKFYEGGTLEYKPFAKRRNLDNG
jgi:V/A-type H+-transporting ATPase subunit I